MPVEEENQWLEFRSHTGQQADSSFAKVALQERLLPVRR